MRMAFFDTHASCDDAQRFMIECAQGARARGWDVRVWLPAEGTLAAWCGARGVPVACVPMPAWACVDASPRWSYLADAAIWRLARLLRADDIEYLYAWSPAAAWLGGCAARLAGCAMIWRPRTAAEMVGRHARWCASLARQLHLPTGMDPPAWPAGLTRKIRPVILGINMEAYPYRPLGRRRRDAPIIGMVGAWTPYAGQELLVKAFRLLHDAGRYARLRLAGVADTPDAVRHRDLVQGIIRAAGLGAWATIEERHADDGAFYAQCDVVVVPALVATPGRRVLEAQAVGRPVVASGLGASSTCIDDGHTGLLTPSDDPRALADALELLLASPALRAEMGRLAHARVREHYSLARALDSVESALIG